MKKYPKILLFGHSFNNKTGMGITLTNLFADWPKENIAIWSSDIDSELCDTIRPCSAYIGVVKSSLVHSCRLKKNVTLWDRCRNVFRKYYYKTGIPELLIDTSISSDHLNDAVVFNPDIIFCALGDLAAMKRCNNLVDKFPNAKLVLYIVDDWVNTKINTRYFAYFWKKKYDTEYRRILNRASGLLSICQYMSEEYYRIYDKTFYPFHNPVDLDAWQAQDVQSKYNENTISILYVGKINADTMPCLKNMCQVIEELNDLDNTFVFDIYSPDYSDKAYLFTGKKNINVFPAVGHESIPSIMKSYNALFLPLGFSKQSRSYVRLSMPTKLTEYLASGRPIVLYCPEEIALTKYLRDKDCSIMCTDEDTAALKTSILRLTDKTHCNHLVKNAVSLAGEHDIHVVRERFRETLCMF